MYGDMKARIAYRPDYYGSSELAETDLGNGFYI
jgi:hypothetical protein